MRTSCGVTALTRLSGLCAVLSLFLAPPAWGAAGSGGGDDNQQITDISWSRSAEQIQVVVATTGRPNHSHYSRTNPPQVVVDLANMEPGAMDAVIPVNRGAIREIRSERLEKDGLVSTRLVVALDDTREYSTIVQGNDLLLQIDGMEAGGDAVADAIEEIESEEDTSKKKHDTQAGEEEEPGDGTREIIDGDLSSVHGDHNYRGGGVRIIGVDFQNYADTSALVITTDSPMEYKAHWATQRQYVLDIPHSVLGTGLERSLDTSKFPSAIDIIHCYQSRSDRGTTKVVVRMREHVEPRPTQEGNVLTLQFEIPPSVAASRSEQFAVYQAFEASDADEVTDQENSIVGAFSREQMITSQGESLDPSKKYGSPGSSGLILEGQWDLRALTGGKAPRLINLDLVQADIHNVFRLISSVSGLNIVSSDTVAGKVTVRMDRVPWDKALASILQAKGLGGILYGNILRIAPLEVIRAEREQALAAEKASIELEDLNILTIPVNFSEAAELSSHVAPVLSSRGTVTVDSRTNTLVIQDIEEGLRQARLLVMALDTQTPQVLIDARIVEVSDNWSRSSGVQWGGNLNFSPATGMPTGLFFPNNIGVSGGKSAPIMKADGSQAKEGLSQFTTEPNWVVDLPGTSDTGSLGLALGSLTGVANLDMRLSAMESAGEGRVVSSPRVQVVTNEQAFIKQGTNIPYETASLRGTEVQFIQATLELRVQPSITSDGTVFLEVMVTKNRPDFGNTVGSYPSIEIKEAETTVMVPNGDTTVIGGVYSLDQSEDSSYIPGIGKVPVLGALFKNKSRRKDRTEMLVFITPTILTSTMPSRGTGN